MTAAIYYTPDGYTVPSTKLMGRHMAGDGFLKAFVASESGSSIWVHAPRPQFAASFERRVREAGFTGKVRSIPLDQRAGLAVPGCVYFPGPGIGSFAWQRDAVGSRSYSLCGVTHTTASHTAMDAISDLLVAPLHSWDALVCTSRAVRDSVRLLVEQKADYFRWKLGATRFAVPQFPLIPLGVDCSQFQQDTGVRAKARRELGIKEADVVVLFVGRLSFHAKAHPQAMYLALEKAAHATQSESDAKRRIHLVQCGWFANDSIEAAFKDSAIALCPSVSCHFVDGRNEDGRKGAWAVADIFISLSENIQETFGLTPIEAMAAGLPVVVSDWDGYRDTVRHEVDGFRIPTVAAHSPDGQDLADRYETGVDSYDMYCGYACELVAVDTDETAAALTQLIRNPELRARMGAAGRERAREVYDWSTIISDYRRLWAELAERRRADPDMAAGSCSGSWVGERPERADPFALFASYPSGHLTDASTLVGASDSVENNLAALASYRALAINSFAEYVYPTQKECAAILRYLNEIPGLQLGGLLNQFPEERRSAIRRGVVWMIKMSVLRMPTSICIKL